MLGKSPGIELIANRDSQRNAAMDGKVKGPPGVPMPKYRLPMMSHLVRY